MDAAYIHFTITYKCSRHQNLKHSSQHWFQLCLNIPRCKKKIQVGIINGIKHGLRTPNEGINQEISENLGRCGRQNMLPPYLKIWEWEWIFGRAVKVISSLDVRSPCFEPLHFSGLFWTWNSVNDLTSVHVNTKCREKFCQLTFARVVELEAKKQWVQKILYIAFEYLCSQIDYTKSHMWFWYLDISKRFQDQLNSKDRMPRSFLAKEVF